MLAFLAVGALGLAVVPAPRLAAGRPLRPSVRRASVRCGFDVEDVSEKAVEELGVFNWPGLEKRLMPFTQSAAADEIMMVYVKEGSGTVAMEGEEDAPVTSGQMLMISDGEAAWSAISEGGLTLLSMTAPLADVADDEPAFDPLNVAPAPAEPEPIQDLTPAEAVKILGFGLAAGAVAAIGFDLLRSA